MRALPLKTIVSATVLAVLAAAVLVLSLHVPGAQAQGTPASRLLPLGASGQLTWYLDTERRQVVMCNAFSDNSIECRSRPMP